jgi:hypothetical protein
MGILEEWPKEGRRVATVDKSVKKSVQVLLLLFQAFNQLKGMEDHSLDHFFQDPRPMGKNGGGQGRKRRGKKRKQKEKEKKFEDSYWLIPWRLMT